MCFGMRVLFCLEWQAINLIRRATTCCSSVSDCRALMWVKIKYFNRITDFLRLLSRAQEISRRLPVGMLDSPPYLSLFGLSDGNIGTVLWSIA